MVDRRDAHWQLVIRIDPPHCMHGPGKQVPQYGRRMSGRHAHPHQHIKGRAGRMNSHQFTQSQRQPGRARAPRLHSIPAQHGGTRWRAALCHQRREAALASLDGAHPSLICLAGSGGPGQACAGRPDAQLAARGPPPPALRDTTRLHSYRTFHERSRLASLPPTAYIKQASGAVANNQLTLFGQQ